MSYNCQILWLSARGDVCHKRTPRQSDLALLAHPLPLATVHDVLRAVEDPPLRDRSNLRGHRAFVPKRLHSSEINGARSEALSSLDHLREQVR